MPLRKIGRNLRTSATTNLNDHHSRRGHYDASSSIAALNELFGKRSGSRSNTVGLLDMLLLLPFHMHLKLYLAKTLVNYRRRTSLNPLPWFAHLFRGGFKSIGPV